MCCPWQAINLYAERPYLQPGLPEARDFAQATEHSKQLTNAFRSDIQKFWDELENARRKLQVSSFHHHMKYQRSLQDFTVAPMQREGQSTQGNCALAAERLPLLMRRSWPAWTWPGR